MKKFKPFYYDNRYSFHYDGSFCYLNVPQPEEKELEFVIDGKTVVLPTKQAALLAHYEVRLPPEYLDKISFLENDSKVLKITCGYEMTFSEPLLFRDDFYYIPGYTNYAVNEDGLVIAVATGRVVNRGSKDPYGYPIVIVRNPDKGSFRAAKIHILLARTFIANPERKTVVNHIDGNKENNILENLEWSTISDNNIHAFKNGLRSDNKPCYVRDIKTGEIIKYYSIAEAARNLGYGNSLPTPKRFINGKEVPLLIRNRYEVNISDGKDWYYNDTNPVRLESKGPFLLRNYETKEILEFNNLMEISKFLKVKVGRVYTANQTNGNRLLNGYQIRPKSADTVPWPENPRKSTDNSPRTFVIVKGDEVIEFNSKVKLSFFLRTSKTTIEERLSSNKTIDGWRILETSLDKYSPDMLNPRPL